MPKADAEQQLDTNLFWVDMEMTGLDPETEVITEIACLVTDKDLNVIAEGPEIVIHHEDAVLDKMNAEVNKIYDRSDLRQKIRTSMISVAEAERAILDFVRGYCRPKMSPYCGNTVSTDKQFIRKYMKNLYDYLHYRVIDVSTVKELAKRWYPKLPLFGKKDQHRAMGDIKESVAELKYYREKIFVNVVK
jgi:oligoribonuclease